MSGGHYEWQAAVGKQPNYTPVSDKLVALVQGAGSVEGVRAN